MRLPFRNNPVFSKFGNFYPEGSFSLHTVSGRRGTQVAPYENPLRDDNVLKETWSGRLLVGLSVRKKQKYHIEDLVALTRAYLAKHKVPQDSSFVSQEGVFTYQSRTVVQEKSAQVIIVNTYMNVPGFKVLLERLAEFLIKKLEQEMIIVEVQRNGIVDVTWLVTSEKATRKAEALDRKKGKVVKRLSLKDIRKS